jgi:hypothetical protein
LKEELATRKDALEKSYAKKLDDANDRVIKAKARDKARSRQRAARIGTAAWVVTDNVLYTMGINLPFRRRSLDPSIRSAATESGQQADAKIVYERALQDQELLQQERDDKLKQLETSLSEAELAIDKLELKPQKGDIDVGEVALVWLPYRISPTGAAEPVFASPAPSH